MTFGDNILSHDQVDWSIVSGSMSSGTLSLNAGGSAVQILSIADLAVIPDQFYLSLIASVYTDAYEPNIYAVIAVQTALNYFEYSVPVIDTGNGFCTVRVPVEATNFIAFSFTIRSDVAVTFTDWVLAVPIAEELDLEGLREEIPKILDDYNTSLFVVAQEEVTIGFITSVLLQSTDMNGHFLLTYTSTASAVLTIRIKDNEITELYTPILYNIVPGRNSIGIPHAYVRKLAGVHTFAVTAQVSVGTIYMVTRGMLFTIDGGHLAKRLIDIDVTITDMSMRQLITELEPSLVYAVGIEDEMARVRFRSFKGSAALVWEPVYEVGPAVYAAMEFNGVWAERLTDVGYTIITEDVPWVFWITPDDDLYGQRGLDEDTLILLATGVSYVSAVRGFKSYYIPQSDQGLVVVYIKSGLVYYRSYATQENSVTLWELEVAITEAGSEVTFAHIARLNDYRLALSITKPSGNILLYTGRTFAGQAFKPGRVVVTNANVPALILDDITYNQGVHNEHAVIASSAINFQYYDSLASLYGPVLTYFEASEDLKHIHTVFDCEFYSIDSIDVADITVSPTNTLLSVAHTAPHTLDFVFSGAVNTAGSIELVFKAVYSAGYVRGGPNWFGNSSWSISFAVPEPALTIENAVVSDSFVTNLQYAPIVFKSVYPEETVTIEDSQILNLEYYPVGTQPI